MPRDGRPTRAKILDAAERLAIDGGFAATSIDAIISASGTSKGAFFHHFASKSGLARALVERYAAADIAHLHRALDALPTGPAVVRLAAFLGYFEDEADDLMAAQSGCLYVAALTEQDLLGSEATASIGRAISSWRNALGALLTDAVTEAGLTWTADELNALADHLFVTFEGSFLLCRATGDRGHMRRQLGVLRALVAALFAQPCARHPSRPGSESERTVPLLRARPKLPGAVTVSTVPRTFSPVPDGIHVDAESGKGALY